jgi:1-acyl-sn-glycerol-3-phosphate acyltransferase
MSNIYDFALSYNLVRNYVVFTFKHFYGEYIVVGRENIPTDCPVIFAPNHTNALMDALAIHSAAPNKMPIIFLARADMFNNKTAAKVLNFMKIMPAFRMRDGVENLGRNGEIFERCVEILDKNKALGIMPEGNQEIERKLRPLVKGIFRIAFAAQRKHGNQPRVKIVPVGLDFGSILKSGKHIIISFGKPIEVSDYMNSYMTNPVIATNEIRDKLRKELSNITLNLDTEKYYKCFESATEICNATYLKKLELPDKTVFKFIARQKLAEKLVEIEKNDTEIIEKLDSLCLEYENVLNDTNLRNWVFEQGPFSKLSLLLDGLYLFGTFPFFLYGFILNFLPFFIPVYLRKNVFKIQFSGFFSSLQYALGIITFPLFYIIQTVLFWRLTDFPLWVSLLFFFVQYPMGKWALKWNSFAKKLSAKIRFNKLRRTKPHITDQAQDLRKEIIQLTTE